MFSCQYCYKQFTQQYDLFRHTQTSVICFRIQNLQENQCICNDIFTTSYDLNVHKQICKTIEIEQLKYRLEEMKTEYEEHIARLTTVYESKISDLLQLIVNSGKKGTNKDFGLSIDFDRECVLNNIYHLTVEDVFVYKFEEVIQKILTKNNEIMYKCQIDASNIFVYKENNVVVRDKSMVKLHALIFKPLLTKIQSLIPLYVSKYNINEDIQFTLLAKYQQMLATSAKMVKTFKPYLIN